jgi:uncharacterized protein (TIGR00255 family)
MLNSISVRSMTGYASASFDFLGEAYTLEVKSLNHRFLDIKARIPRELSSLEIWLKKELSQYVCRGSLDFMLNKAPSQAADFGIDLKLAESAYQQLIEVKRRLGIQTEVSVKDVLSLMAKTTVDPSKQMDVIAIQEPLAASLKDLMRQLIEMKTSEGLKIQESCNELVNQLMAHLSQVQSRRAALALEIQQKRTKKVSELFAAYGTVDEKMTALLETRISQELVLALDKTDVQEELSRLEAHLQSFHETLSKGESGKTGKKLEFLCQEIHREITTLGNKAQDTLLSSVIVNMKVLSEQIREQVANIE